MDGGDLYSPLAPMLTAPLTVVPFGLVLLLLFKVEVVAGYTWVRFGPMLAVAVLFHHRSSPTSRSAM